MDSLRWRWRSLERRREKPRTAGLSSGSVKPKERGEPDRIIPTRIAFCSAPGNFSNRSCARPLECASFFGFFLFRDREKTGHFFPFQKKNRPELNTQGGFSHASGSFQPAPPSVPLPGASPTKAALDPMGCASFFGFFPASWPRKNRSLFSIKRLDHPIQKPLRILQHRLGHLKRLLVRQFQPVSVVVQ